MPARGKGRSVENFFFLEWPVPPLSSFDDSRRGYDAPLVEIGQVLAGVGINGTDPGVEAEKSLFDWKLSCRSEEKLTSRLCLQRCACCHR
jgi:hypothetical protein